MMYPLGDRVLVTPIIEETKTESGIVLSDGQTKALMKGEVVEAGETKTVEKGDIVYFSEHGGTEIKKELMAVDVDNLLAKEI